MSSLSGPHVALLLFVFTLGAARGDLQSLSNVFRHGYATDSLRNFTQLATEYGYESEQHTVTTEDGYILTIFRITKGKRCRFARRHPPVLLMHGLLMSADCWLDAGPEAGLAYLISDACYDLWAGNVRGNYYGRKHAYLDPNEDPQFWDFTVTEIGRYDVPAMIDYILKYTESDKMNYVGHSQGGGTFFIMNSERPEYTKKIKVAIMLEPASRLRHEKSLFSRAVTEAYELFEPYLDHIGLYEALPKGGIVQNFTGYICQDYIVADTVCRGILDMIDSPHPGSVTVETIRVAVGHFPAGTSVKNMAWYGQDMKSDDFKKFDYGPVMNYEVYGSVVPPQYNLNATKNPVVIINGLNDFLTVPVDVQWLADHLPNVVEHYIVKDPLWNHLDVTYSRYTRRDIFPKISEYLFKYSEKGV